MSAPWLRAPRIDGASAQRFIYDEEARAKSGDTGSSILMGLRLAVPAPGVGAGVTRTLRTCGRDHFVAVFVSFVVVRAGSVPAAMGSLSTWQTLTTVAEQWFAELESV